MILEVYWLETYITRNQNAVWTRHNRWRVESDNIAEDPYRVAAAPFAASTDWNNATIKDPKRQTWYWNYPNETQMGAQPDGNKHVYDNDMMLVRLSAKIEKPIDRPDGNRFYWLVEGEYWDWSVAAMNINEMVDSAKPLVGFTS